MYIQDVSIMYPLWKGFEVRPSRSADKEMAHLRVYLDDVLRILEDGKNCEKSKRKKGVFEKRLRIRGQMIRITVVKSETRWSGDTVWLIIHVGEDSER